MPYSGVACFWMERTGEVFVELRRYALGSHCPGPWDYHNASVTIGKRRARFTDDGTLKAVRAAARTHKRWPKKCKWCSYRFRVRDMWQTNGNLVYRRADTGEELELRHPETGSRGSGPPGALFHNDWHPFGIWSDRYGDGINLQAVCPNGTIWNVDGPAVTDGDVKTPEAWTRTGDPRQPETLTAAPSIVAGDYHGFLQAGRFTDG